MITLMVQSALMVYTAGDENRTITTYRTSLRNYLASFALVCSTCFDASVCCARVRSLVGDAWQSLKLKSAYATSAGTNGSLTRGQSVAPSVRLLDGTIRLPEHMWSPKSLKTYLKLRLQSFLLLFMQTEKSSAVSLSKTDLTSSLKSIVSRAVFHSRKSVSMKVLLSFLAEFLMRSNLSSEPRSNRIIHDVPVGLVNLRNLSNIRFVRNLSMPQLGEESMCLPPWCVSVLE